MDQVDHGCGDDPGRQLHSLEPPLFFFFLGCPTLGKLRSSRLHSHAQPRTLRAALVHSNLHMERERSESLSLRDNR